MNILIGGKIYVVVFSITGGVSLSGLIIFLEKHFLVDSGTYGPM